jgi:hypothetical protein
MTLMHIYTVPKSDPNDDATDSLISISDSDLFRLHSTNGSWTHASTILEPYVSKGRFLVRYLLPTKDYRPRVGTNFSRAPR